MTFRRQSLTNRAYDVVSVFPEPDLRRRCNTAVIAVLETYRGGGNRVHQLALECIAWPIRASPQRRRNGIIFPRSPGAGTIRPLSHHRNRSEDKMRKLTMTLAAAAAVLVTINMSAFAQVQAPAGAGIQALVQNSTPGSSNRRRARAGARTARPALSEPAARIVAGAVRATDRIRALRGAAFGGPSLIAQLISINRRAKI